MVKRTRILVYNPIEELIFKGKSIERIANKDKRKFNCKQKDTDIGKSMLVSFAFIHESIEKKKQGKK